MACSLRRGTVWPAGVRAHLEIGPAPSAAPVHARQGWSLAQPIEDVGPEPGDLRGSQAAAWALLRLLGTSGRRTPGVSRTFPLDHSDPLGFFVTSHNGLDWISGSKVGPRDVNEFYV